MKKFLVPIAVGVAVFGGVTAFAATLTVNSKSLAAGNAVVAACNDNAAVTYTTTGSKVATAVVTISGSQAAGHCDNLPAEVTLLGTGNSVLATRSATVGATTTDIATVNFSADNVDASAVTGVAVVITG